MKRTMLSLLVATVFSMAVMAEEIGNKSDDVLMAYANIATDNYALVLEDVIALEKAVKAFTSKPTKEGLDHAKTAWLRSRESYGQTEIFRLVEGPIDAQEGWVYEMYGGVEGELNAWPLDENMIDYMIDAKGQKTANNIIDTQGIFTPQGMDSKGVDVRAITVESLTALNENGGNANVATGYHAVEFLLWGQDQDYANFVKDTVSHGATTAGQRPVSDYTSDAHALRRIAYLNVVTQKLVQDVRSVNLGWSRVLSSDCSKDASGCYRAALLGLLEGKDSDKNIKRTDFLKILLSSMGVFMKSELANERIAVAVLTPSEEDEHSCFSDNTHRDIAMNYQGFKNVLSSSYEGKIYGVSLLDAMDMKSKEKLLKLMGKIEKRIAKIDALARTTEHFDYQIQPDNKNARRIVTLKNQMRKLGDMMVIVATANGINLSVDDVTDAQETQL
ncbi:MAG: imelysin family protein [Sulfurovum sp.]|nr:imelysin family protein [Sulfurovum sp.]